MNEGAKCWMWHPATMGEIHCLKQADGTRRIEVLIRQTEGRVWSHYVDVGADVTGFEPILAAMKLCSEQLLERMQRAMRASEA